MVDASAALSAVLNAGPARGLLSSEQLHVPHLIDSEIVNGMRRQVVTRSVTAEQAWAALDTWRRLGIVRHPVSPLLERIWQLRDNMSAYDASYVTLAEALGCAVVTADGRLGRAPGSRCPITVVPR
ncbi:type II toxin-antitoxin system VapC family toxin [Blastococcus mobilis]|uniref:type II toxin-antitoxin system VapC family toxin n=1 Tax=Blastococcus mobilis TaxID=1938746 RepID=UPI001C3DB8C8|nr:type II toxin-antitoxin system VapC family toxin [Blastococcus mobilis]